MTDKQNVSGSKILVIDDEELICDLIKYNLENDGFKVDICHSAEEALTMNLKDYQLMVIDVMMSEMSGVKFAHIVKQNPETAHISIIFCTARDSEDDIIKCLNTGADDYIAKPFSLRELSARVQSVLRRYNNRNHTKQPNDTIKYKGLKIEVSKQTVSIDDNPITLTRTEFDILVLLMQNINKFFSREEIFKQVWKEHVIVSDRTIDVNISRLRKKIGSYASNLINRSGFGYGFSD